MTSSRFQRRTDRRGLNLLEIMLVVAIVVAVFSVAVPIGTSVMGLREKRAATQLAGTWSLLRDEARLTNRTFRLAFHLDEGFYEVEVGDANSLLFATPEERVAYEQELAEAMERTPDALQGGSGPPPGAGGLLGGMGAMLGLGGGAPQESTILDSSGQRLTVQRFETLSDRFHKRFDLPAGLLFSGVYTPQYGEFVEPSGADPADLEEHEKTIVYAYVLPNGFAEHAVVHIARVERPDSGYTVEIEPMTGKAGVRPGLHDFEDRFDFIPDQAPQMDR